LFELDKNDYKNWARGLKQAGYATNPKYPELLINLIDRYQLYQYDQSESERDKIKREDRVFTEINANIPKEKEKFSPVATPPSKQVIKTPDTLRISAPIVRDSTNQKNTAPTFKPSTYTVKQGDTLYNISKRFNISIDDLKSLNGISDTDIKIGQTLILVK